MKIILGSHKIRLKNKDFFKYHAFTFIWVAVILFLTLLPGQHMPTTLDWDMLSFDKLAHMGVFCLLVFLTNIGSIKQSSYKYLKRNAYSTSIGFGITYGLIIELLQSAIPGRSLEWNDLLANIIGCILGFVIFWLIYKL